MTNLKNRLIRLLALSTIIALTALSLQSLQLKYIELPAYHQAGINAVKKVAAERDKIIVQLDQDNLDLVSALNKRNQELKDKDLVINIQLSAIQTQKALTAQETRKVNDLVAINAINMGKAQEVVDQASAIIAQQGQAIMQQEADIQKFLLLVATEYIRRDECVAVKDPPCMNSELNGNPGACDF